MRNSIAFILIIILLTSCGKAKVFELYKPTDNNTWHKDSIMNFTFSTTDTLAKNNVFINLRNNKEYEYSNLFLIVGIEFPNNTNIVDTLEYEMADTQGKFLGTGLTDLKENKLEYKTNVVFPTKGEYNINVQQAMRKSGQINGIESLNGITEVGISIEKTEK